jgi:hypothetical protein
MMRFYYIPLFLILLFASGWLFRKPLAASGAKIFVRIFVGLFAVAGAVVWTLLLLALKQLAHAWTGAGDGAGTGGGSIPPEDILLAAAVWFVPVTAFAFMLLGALNVLRGALRHISYRPLRQPPLRASRRRAAEAGPVASDHQDWLAGNYGGGASSIVNFYNTNDYALSRYHWQFDELVKPDQNVLENGDHWYYGYDGSPSDPAPWNNFYKQDTNSTIFDFNIVTSLNNRYEVMAYAAQSYTTALGATPSVGNVSGNIYLGRITAPRIWPPDPTGNNYTEHFWHSAEFRGDNVMMQGYWSELLGSDAFNLK